MPHVLFSSFLPRLSLTVILIGSTTLGHAASCPVIHTRSNSPADQAFLHGDFDQAATLYQQQLQQNANNPPDTVGLVHTLLKQQKVQEADDLIQKALNTSPTSVPLLIARGEVEYREGKPWLALATVQTVLKTDLCDPQLHLLEARLYRLSSFYASAARELALAHSIQPDDPSIRLRWLETLPGQERIAQLEAYLDSPTGNDPDELRHLRFYLAFLKKQADQPRKACHLVSDTSTTSIPFAAMMQDATHVRAYGLDVKLNDHTARLQIDTGAGGLLISRAVANHANLQRLSNGAVGGVGDRGEQAAYSAIADSIKIGSLEFRDCQVEVIDQRNIADSDGLIGMDVFSRFLVTLDYPMRKLLLGPLPPRPDEVAPAKPSLETPSALDDYDDSAPSSDQKAAAPRGPFNRYIAPEMKDWIPVYRVGHNLLLSATLNNKPGKIFILDTGAFTTSVTPAIAHEVSKVHQSDLIVKGISGKVDKVYAADEITFKFANLSQVVREVVAFDTPNISKNAGMEVAGFIGITALGQTTMKIDYRDGLVSFSYDANRGYKF